MSRIQIAVISLALPIILIAACKDGRITTTKARTANEPRTHDTSGFFDDLTAQTGIDFTYDNGEQSNHYAILESLGGGAAVIDFDRDGRLDLFFPGGGYFDGPDGPAYKKRLDEYETKKKNDPSAAPPAPPAIRGRPGKLYRNLGDWKFEDVTAKAGLDKQSDVYTHGCAVADYNRDGWPDLLVTGYGRVTLYRNEQNNEGGRRFIDVTESAGLLAGGHFWSTSAAFGDFDGDGNPDLYLCQYVDWSWSNHPACPGYNTDFARDVCPPKQFNSTPHALFHNQGNGTFKNVAKQAGIRVTPGTGKDCGMGLGVLLLDADGDRKLDIYVCNDTTDNFLYLNRSEPGRIALVEQGFALGVAADQHGTANGSMGVWAADFEGTGRPSIWVTNYENEYHALYRNTLVRGKTKFEFHSSGAGLTAIGPNYVGFGTAFIDADRDGWEDMVIANGHVIRHPPRDNLRQQPILFMNQAKAGSRRFIEAAKDGGSYFASVHRGRGLAVGDFDNDGASDLVLTHVNEPVAILRGTPASSRWLGIELAPRENRSAVGAKLTLEAGGRKLTRFVLGGGSYLCAHDSRVIFGLGESSEIGKLTIEWPSGATQSWSALEAGKYHLLKER